MITDFDAAKIYKYISEGTQILDVSIHFLTLTINAEIIYLCYEKKKARMKTEFSILLPFLSSAVLFQQCTFSTMNN